MTQIQVGLCAVVGHENLADFDNRHLHGIGRADASATFDELLDFVGDMGNDLHGLAQVVATALFFQHGLVNLARGEVVGLFHARFDETLIVAQIQVGLCAVVGHENLAVLKRRHGARVYVDVGVKLDEGDFESPRFEDRGKRGGGDSLAQGRHHTAGHEDKFGHVFFGGGKAGL